MVLKEFEILGNFLIYSKQTVSIETLVLNMHSICPWGPRKIQGVVAALNMFYLNSISDRIYIRRNVTINEYALGIIVKIRYLPKFSCAFHQEVSTLWVKSRTVEIPCFSPAHVQPDSGQNEESSNLNWIGYFLLPPASNCVNSIIVNFALVSLNPLINMWYLVCKSTDLSANYFTVVALLLFSILYPF